MVRMLEAKAHRMSDDGRSLCGLPRQINSLTLLTEVDNDVTCKLCVKSMEVSQVIDQSTYGDCECCGARLTGDPECQVCLGTP